MGLRFSLVPPPPPPPYVWCTCRVTSVSFYPTLHSAIILNNELQQQLKLPPHLSLPRILSPCVGERACGKAPVGEQIPSHIKRNPPHSSHWGRQCASLKSAPPLRPHTLGIQNVRRIVLMVSPAEINTPHAKDGTSFVRLLCFVFGLHRNMSHRLNISC